MPFLDFFGGIVLVVFGIDPGYAIVGWGAINFQSNTYKTLGYGAIETVAGTDFNKRLEYIYDETYAILNRCRPDALAIEKLYFQTNQKTAINVAQARGVTLLAALFRKRKTYCYRIKCGGSRVRRCRIYVPDNNEHTQSRKA